MLKINLSDTIVALSTPPGVGAIAVIRLSGPTAFQIADQFFRGRKKLAEAKSHTVHFGQLLAPAEKGAADERLIDEIVATIFRGPKSYTGDDTVELSCHGSPFIQQKILALFLENGARLAQPGEFTQRAFLNGKLDLAQAEAVADLIASETDAAHRVALTQMRGGFSSEIKVLRDELIHFASLVELELDFGEEDVEFADRALLKSLVLKIRKHIAQLIESFALGNAIKNGVQTVIAGRPNAGKSTLLNALLNEDRAIVSEIAGTTRDSIEEILNIKGIRFRLIDTAGIREATDEIEKIGVQKTMEKIGSAAILVYLFDVVETPLSEVFKDLESLDFEKSKLLVVCNKMDLAPTFEIADCGLRIAEFGSASEKSAIRNPYSVISLAAKHSMNVPFLKEKLVEIVAGGAVNLEATVVTSARHADALKKADGSLGEVLEGLENGFSKDFVAQDIRRALHFLGEITGEIGVDDLLASIFSRFCIGK